MAGSSSTRKAQAHASPPRSPASSTPARSRCAASSAGGSAAADFEIVQTAVRRRRTAAGSIMPHWPQPGLVPRDASRGERFERIAYKGYANNLHRDFHGGGWSGFLAGHGILMGERTRCASPARRRTGRPRLARLPRPSTPSSRCARRAVETAAKPATKLANAWLAGVPALLGPEPSYRALPARRARLSSRSARPEEARAAVERLRSEPGLHRAMVENGRGRAREVSPEAVTAAWRTLLEETLPPLARRRRSFGARFVRAVDGLRLRAAGAARPPRAGAPGGRSPPTGSGGRRGRAGRDRARPPRTTGGRLRPGPA